MAYVPPAPMTSKNTTDDGKTEWSMAGTVSHPRLWLLRESEGFRVSIEITQTRALTEMQRLENRMRHLASHYEGHNALTESALGACNAKAQELGVLHSDQFEAELNRLKQVYEAANNAMSNESTTAPSDEMGEASS